MLFSIGQVTTREGTGLVTAGRKNSMSYGKRKNGDGV
jgi:hypothetical protein